MWCYATFGFVETVAPIANHIKTFFFLQVKYGKWTDTAVDCGNCNFLEHFFTHARTCNEMNSLYAQPMVYVHSNSRFLFALFTQWFHGEHMRKAARKRWKRKRSHFSMVMPPIIFDPNFSWLFTYFAHFSAMKKNINRHFIFQSFRIRSTVVKGFPSVRFHYDCLLRPEKHRPLDNGSSVWFIIYL